MTSRLNTRQFTLHQKPYLFYQGVPKEWSSQGITLKNKYDSCIRFCPNTLFYSSRGFFNTANCIIYFDAKTPPLEKWHYTFALYIQTPADIFFRQDLSLPSLVLRLLWFFLLFAFLKFRNLILIFYFIVNFTQTTLINLH